MAPILQGIVDAFRRVTRRRPPLSPRQVPTEAHGRHLEYAPDLDRRLDARADEFASRTDPRWTGWHRLEHALWVSGDRADLSDLADSAEEDEN